MRCIETSIFGVLLVEPKVFTDARGLFLETYQRMRYQECGVHSIFVQDNHSHSRQGTLRGLHYQLAHAQAKLIYVVSGEIFDVVVDIRKGSPSYGKWFGATLTRENKHQIYIPEGFAHGFCALSETADVIYKASDFYTPGDEYGIFWADPDIGINWPLSNPLLSEKDAANPRLREVPEEQLPAYRIP